jgi:O-antigen ligase
MIATSRSFMKKQNWISFGSILERMCSLYALCICILAMVAVISSYVFGLLQPVRWPTLIYFLFAFVLTLSSVRIATWVLIFSFPLLSDLHVQLSYLVTPKVPYFVGYPGLDVATGYITGLTVVFVMSRGRDKISLVRPPWPAGLFLLLFSVSTATAIWRNLQQTNSEFGWNTCNLQQTNTEFVWTTFFNTVISFKLTNKLNDYYPVVDMLVYTVAILLFTVLVQQLKKTRDPNDAVFQPVIVAAILSALLGIFQAVTSFGLHENVSGYRPEGIGYGAVGFQPDLHAFGAHMLVGTVGLLGYFSSTTSKQWRLAIGVVITLCCLALVLSKSRASAVFFLIATFIYLSLMLKSSRLTTRHWKWLGLFGVAAIAVCITQSFTWIGEISAALENDATTAFQKANEISRYRLEIFIGALRIFASAPLFGIGHGTFFRVSRDQELTGTSWFFDVGGENAHNYFLQTLAEVGLVGSAVCVLFFAYPFFSKHHQSSSGIKPALWALIAIGLGNIYSHSLVVRENLFLLAVFTALFYVETRNKCEVADDKRACNTVGFEETRPRWLPVFAALVTCGMWFAPRVEGIIRKLLH